MLKFFNVEKFYQAAAGYLGALEAVQRLRHGLGLLLIRERSGAGRCARRGSRAAAAPSALGWSIGAAAADPGRVRPRCRAERRAAAMARSAASCGRCGPSGCPGSGAAAPAWAGPAPDPGEIQRGQLRHGVDRGQRQRLRPWNGLSALSG